MFLNVCKLYTVCFASLFAIHAAPTKQTLFESEHCASQAKLTTTPMSVTNEQKRLEQATALLEKLRLAGQTAVTTTPTIRLEDPTANKLPLPPIAHLQGTTEELLVSQARLDLRAAMQQILEAMDSDKVALTVNKERWREIRTALVSVSKHGSPDDLFEATMDFMYLVVLWLGTLWKLIAEKQDLALLKEEQSRLEEYWHLIEQSPKRSRATILVLAEVAYNAHFRGQEASRAFATWRTDSANRHKILEAFAARIGRWEAEAKRLLRALELDGVGLMPCHKDPVFSKNNRHRSSPTGSPGNLSVSESDVGGDTDEILGITSDSDSNDSDYGEGSGIIFTPPQGSKDPKVWQELNDLIGLQPVKQHLQEIIANVSAMKSKKEMPMMHLMLAGNPGVGKTTFARLYARVLKDLKLLKKGHLVEEKMATLTGKYLGESETNTRKAIEEAQGGVLFIDEVHQLIPSFGGHNDYSKKIVDAIMPELENKRGSFVAVFATYSSKVDGFLDLDPGLRRRISERITFPDYSDSELAEILERMAASEGLELEPDLAEKVGIIIGKLRGTADYANAGSVRNAFETAQRKRNMRIYKTRDKEEMLKAKDFKFLKDVVAKAKASTE